MTDFCLIQYTFDISVLSYISIVFSNTELFLSLKNSFSELDNPLYIF